MTQGRYWAFISYSHADEAVATWLHKALETYRLPKKLVGTVQGGVEIPARLFPVFRDRDELASSDSLGAKINDALARAEALIVIASKKSASSHWVNEEIRAFKALGKGRRVFCVIADGEPFASDKGAPDEECFAPALRRHVDADGQLTEARAEPIAADIRPGKDGKHDALLKLIAGILDIGLDALKQRDLQRRQRRLTVIASAAVAAALFTTGLSVFAIQARNEAQAQRRLAEIRQTQAEGLIQFMLGDLRKKLEPIGKLDILDAVGEQAMAYFGQVPPETLSDTELAARAQALRQIGDVRVQQGKLADASPAFREALRLDEELVRRHPDDQQAIFNMAQSEFYIGYDLYLRSQYEEAHTWFVRYGASADRLNELAPENLDWQREKVYALDNLATVGLRLGLYADCQISASTAAEIALRILDRQPDDDLTQQILASNYNKIGTCAGTAGDSIRQVEFLRKAVMLSEQRLAADPAALALRQEVATAEDSLVAPLLVTGQIAEAATRNKRARIHWSALTEHDSTNVRHREFLLSNRRAGAEILILQDHYLDALAEVESAISSISADQQVADEALFRHYTELRLRTLRLALLEHIGRSAEAAEEASRLRSLLAQGLAQFTTRDPREQIACLQLPADVSDSACNTILAAQLPNPADPLYAVVQAMRETISRRSLTQSAAARTLAERNYHGAEWHLFKRRHTPAGFQHQ